MQMLCTNCLNIDKVKQRPDFFFPLGGFLIGVGVAYMPIEFFHSPLINLKSTFYMFFSIAEIILGSYMVFSFIHNQSKLCNKCKYGAMIDLECDEAKQIIDQYNLQV